MEMCSKRKRSRGRTPERCRRNRSRLGSCERRYFMKKNLHDLLSQGIQAHVTSHLRNCWSTVTIDTMNWFTDRTIVAMHKI